MTQRVKLRLLDTIPIIWHRTFNVIEIKVKVFVLRVRPTPQPISGRFTMMPFETSIAQHTRCKLLCVLAIGVAVTACTSPNPAAELDEFREATGMAGGDTGADVGADAEPTDAGPSDAGPSDAGTEPCFADPAGTFLLAAIVAPLDRDAEKPLLIDLTLTATADTYTFSFQPLRTDLDPLSGEARDNPRTPVGEPIIVEQVAVSDDGAFFIEVPGIVVDGEANPLTGREIIADLTLAGSFASDDVLCGELGGNAISPIPLPLDGTGSSFGGVRTDDFVEETDPLRTCEDQRVTDACVGDGGGSDECYSNDPTGDYLFAGIVAPLDRDAEKPLLIALNLSGDVGNYIFSFQPLRTDIEPLSGEPRSNPRTPVGDPIVVSGADVASDGSFEIEVPDIVIDGEANPLTGREIIANLTLAGSFASDEFGCGELGGAATSPIPLPLDGTGSSFGFLRTTDFLSVDNPLQDCADERIATACD